MINRYDTPAKLNFVDTFVPIPFQELLAAQRLMDEREERDYNRAEKLRKEFDTLYDGWKQFTSPSTVDTNRYHELTIGSDATQAYINRVVSDPSYVNTAEGRADLANLKYQMDKPEVRNIVTNASLLTEYLKNQSDLRAKGFDVWDPIDVANYNTSGYTDVNGRFIEGKGVLSNTSPMLRQEIVDIVAPYVKDLGDTTSIQGDYLFTGRSKKRLGDQIEANRANILSDPQSMKHIEELTKTLGSKDAAVNAFMDQAKQAAYRFERGTLSANPFKLVDYKNTKSSGDGNGATGGETPMSFTQEIETSGRAAVNNAQHRAINKSLERNAPDHFKALQTAIAYRDAAKSNGNAELEVHYQDQIDQIMTAVNALPNRDAILSDAELPKYFRDNFLAGSIIPAGTADNQTFNYVPSQDAHIKSMAILNDISAGSQAKVTQSSAKQFLPLQEKSDKLYDTSSILSVDQMACALSNVNYTPTALEYGLRNNLFADVELEGVTKTISIGSPGAEENFAIVRLRIPESSLGTPEEAQEIAKAANGVKGVDKKSARVTMKTDDEGALESTTTNVGEDQTYYVFDMCIPFTNSSGGVSAVRGNQRDWQQNMTSTYTNPLFGEQQFQIYNNR